MAKPLQNSIKIILLHLKDCQVASLPVLIYFFQHLGLLTFSAPAGCDQPGVEGAEGSDGFRGLISAINTVHYISDLKGCKAWGTPCVKPVLVQITTWHKVLPAQMHGQDELGTPPCGPWNLWASVLGKNCCSLQSICLGLLRSCLTIAGFRG